MEILNSSNANCIPLLVNKKETSYDSSDNEGVVTPSGL